MADKITIKLKGWDELAAGLKKFGPKLARKHASAALKKGCDIVVEEAKILAPVETGALEAAITSVAVRTTEAEVRRSIGVLKTVSWRAHFVEFGTSKMSARPFLRPALDVRHEDAIAIMAERMAEGLEKEAKETKKAKE